MTEQARIAVLMDPIESINPKKDSTFALLLAAQALKLSPYYIFPRSLCYRQGFVEAKAAPIELRDNTDQWYHLEVAREVDLATFDQVLIRYEPPFDQNYLYVTQLLQLVEQQGVSVVNSPQGLQMINEKLGILHFPDYCTPTLVSSDNESLQQFVGKHEQVIVKPLDGMGGQGIFYLHSDLPNQQATLEMLTQNFTKPIMAQRYIPSIRNGDKRLFIFHGDVFPYALIRLPKKGETRANMALGGQVNYAKLSDYELNMAQTIADYLTPLGLNLVGLDVIGDCLTEINVTCPTGMRELTQLTGIDVAQDYFKRAY